VTAALPAMDKPVVFGKVGKFRSASVLPKLINKEDAAAANDNVMRRGCDVMGTP